MSKIILSSYASAIVGIAVGIVYAIFSRLLTRLFERVMLEINQHHIIALMILRLIVIGSIWALVFHFTSPEYQFVVIGFFIGALFAVIGQMRGMQ